MTMNTYRKEKNLKRRKCKNSGSDCEKLQVPKFVTIWQESTVQKEGVRITMRACSDGNHEIRLSGEKKKILSCLLPSLQTKFGVMDMSSLETLLLIPPYVARYVLKKLAGGGKQDQESPEYVAMSRKPGIAEKWFQKYKDDVYPHDKLIISDKIKLRPPRYFDDRYEVDHKRQMELIKAKRRKKGKTMGPEGEWDRMQVKRRLKEYKINHLQRSFENGNLQRPGQQNGIQRSSKPGRG